MKKSFFVNWKWCVVVFVAVISFLGAVDSALENEAGGGIIALFVLSMLCVFLGIRMPSWFTIDKEGIRLYYLLFFKEYILWKKVSCIYIRSYHPVFIFLDSFHIEGEWEMYTYSFAAPRIPRSFRARKLIEKYSELEIEGYLIDEITQDVRDYGIKSGKWWPGYFKVSETEKNARAQLLRVLTEKNKFTVRECEKNIKYFYGTNKRNSKKRPCKAYTYYAEIKLHNINKIIPIASVSCDSKKYIYKIYTDKINAIKTEDVKTGSDI